MARTAESLRPVDVLVAGINLHARNLELLLMKENPTNADKAQIEESFFLMEKRVRQLKKHTVNE